MANILHETGGKTAYQAYLDYLNRGTDEDIASHDMPTDTDIVEREILEIQQQLEDIKRKREEIIAELTQQRGSSPSPEPRTVVRPEIKSQPVSTNRVKDSPVVPPKQDYVQQGQESRRPLIGELIRRKSNDVMVFTRNHKNRLGAAALGFILSAGSIGVSNIYEAQNNTVEQEAKVSSGGMVRFSGETGIALVVNTTDNRQVVEPSRKTGLSVEIDSYAKMDIHVPPEDLPNFANIKDTDDPTFKKVEIDRKYLLIGFNMRTPDEEIEEGMKDEFRANLQRIEDDQKVVENDMISPEEDAKLRMFVVEKRDDDGNLSEGNKGYYAASKLAGVGALLDTPAGQKAIKEMSDATDDLVVKTYEELGRQRQLKYQVEFKQDSRYTSAAERLIKASKGEEIDTVVRGEKADRSAFELTERPEFNSRISEILTGVPAK